MDARRKPRLTPKPKVNERSPETPTKKHRRPVTSAAVSGSPVVKLGSAGKPLPLQVQTPIENSLGTDMSGVRIHDDAQAQRASSKAGARAFTYGSNIYLGKGESATDLPLMAHEAAHTIQQQVAPAVQLFPYGSGINSYEAEAHRAAHAVLTGQPFTVMTRTGGNTVQPLLGIIGERLNRYARHIPGYTLFTVIIQFNPLTSERVERTPFNLLEGLMGLVPFGTAIFDALRDHGILQDAFNWVQAQLARFDLSLARLERTIEAAWDELSFNPFSDAFDDNINVLIRHFGALYNDVRGFANSVIDHLIDLITEVAIRAVEGLLADNAAWALIKKVLHYDPLRNVPVEATTVEILEDFLRLIGKEQELTQMRERGTLQKTADWLDTQIGTFMALLEQLGGLFRDAWTAIQPENLPNLRENLTGLVQRAGNFLQRLWTFATTVATKVLELIKDALLNWLKSFATDVPGYHLLTVILGRDVFTQQEVPRTPINLIRGFMSLLPGGEQQFQQMSETGVIPQAAQRIETLMSELGISWEFVRNLFIGLWNSLTINDLLEPIAAFERIAARFGEPISRLFTFVIEVIKIVIELILVMMNFPSELISSIITNAMQAFEDIKRDPVGFLLNLLRTVKEGFTRFFDNFLTHLMNGLVEWLFGQLRGAGVEPPTDLSLASLLDFTLGVLGITMENIWSKLAERIGQENVDRIRRAIDTLTGIWTFIQDVQERGVAAIWEHIESQISNLWNTILDQAKNFVMEQIVNRVVERLLTMLDPTGVMAVVNSFIAFFNAVQSAIEYFRQILEIINDFVTTVAAVARGDVNPGAERMEQGLAAALPVAIGFLANQVGLGRIGTQIVGVIQGIRQMIDNAINWLLDRAISMGRAILNRLGFGREEEPSTEDTTGRNIDRPTQIGEEQHTLRAHIAEDARVSIQMASNGFADFHERVEQVKQYAQIFLSSQDSQAFQGRMDSIITQAIQVAQTSGNNIAQFNAQLDNLGSRLHALLNDYNIPRLNGITNFRRPVHSVEYMGYVGNQRARGVVARLSWQTREQFQNTAPPDNVPGVGIYGSGYHRGHLLAASLGGSNTDLRNFAMQSSSVNLNNMRAYERPLYNLIRQNVFPPLVLQYTVVCNYTGNVDIMQNWLTQRFDAPPGAGRILFNLVQRIPYGQQIGPQEVHSALQGSKTLPEITSAMPQIREQLAQNFMPSGFAISIIIEQGEVPPGLIPNQQDNIPNI